MYQLGIGFSDLHFQCLGANFGTQPSIAAHRTLQSHTSILCPQSDWSSRLRYLQDDEIDLSNRLAKRFSNLTQKLL